MLDSNNSGLGTLIREKKGFHFWKQEAWVNLSQLYLHKAYYMDCDFQGWKLWTPRSLVNWHSPVFPPPAFKWFEAGKLKPEETQSSDPGDLQS